MRLAAIASFALATSAAFAQGPAADLDAAYAACLPHTHSLAEHSATSTRVAPFDPGWEHCATINSAWIARDQARAATDEARDPMLKMSRSVARKIQDGEIK